MFQPRLFGSFVRVPNLRSSGFRLYASFAFIVFFFSLITLLLDSVIYWGSPDEATFRTASRQNLQAFSNSKDIKSSMKLSTGQNQANAERPGQIPNCDMPHMIWDTSLRYTDRIVEQLNYVPKLISSKKINILVWQKNGGEIIKPGTQKFKDDGCRVSSCRILTEFNETTQVDALVTSLFISPDDVLAKRRQPDDVWMYYQLESPLVVGYFRDQHVQFNWTSTYRYDSTIVSPYEKWVPFENSSDLTVYYGTVLEDVDTTIKINNTRGKRKVAAALISNCTPMNRMQIIKALKRHIPVDIYGACGSQCGVGCLEMIRRDYKFYLAFENANCVDYITEKLFINALNNSVLPVVFGAPSSDYRRVAPPYSYIHVDDFPSVGHLAKYLRELAKNDALYNSYFQWKGTGTFINTKFWCRLCAMLNDMNKPRLTVRDLNSWLSQRICKKSYYTDEMAEPSKLKGDVATSKPPFSPTLM